MNARQRESHDATDGGDSDGVAATASVSATRDKSPYQLLPPLTADEYAALRDSIAAEGIRVPIQVDEDGQILDGHHRQQIADELGIECPRIVVSNLDTETAKRTVALGLNLSRRHLNREQARHVIAVSLEADPQLSDREHARRLGVSPTTVGTVRKQLEVSKLDTIKKQIAQLEAQLIGSQLLLVDLVLSGKIRDDVDLENTLRRLIPDNEEMRQALAPIVEETAARARGRLRHLDSAGHDATLSAALRKYGIKGVEPYLDYFPYMTRSEFAGMTESAADHGWVSPVTVVREMDGTLTLLDGRCRLIASMTEGVPECPLREIDLDPESRVDYIYSVNVMRYHHTPDELAARKAILFAAAGEDA